MLFLLIIFTTQLGFSFSEQDLISLSRKANTTSLSLKQNLDQARLARLNEVFRFSPRVFASASRSSSNQDAPHSFMPTFSPSEHIEFGIEQKFQLGFSARISGFSNNESTSNNSIDGAGQFGLKAKLNFDLWNNFLGRIDKIRFSEIDRMQNVSNLRSLIEQKKFELMNRKIFWTMVANHEATVLTKSLAEQANIQLNQAKKRARSSVGDTSDVLRYATLHTSRLKQLRLFEYRKRQLLFELKSQFPDLKGEISTYKVSTAMPKVSECINKIEKKASTPLDYTPYDEWLSLLETSKEAETISNNVNFSFFAEYERDAVGEKHSGAFKEFQSSSKPATTLGLSLSVPIGGNDQRITHLRQAMAKRKTDIEIQNARNLINARHSETLPMIKALKEVANLQKNNAKNRSSLVSETKKKFDQARVSVDAVVKDQSELMASELTSVETQLSVVHEVLDYLAIFSETPCSFNY